MIWLTWRRVTGKGPRVMMERKDSPLKNSPPSFDCRDCGQSVLTLKEYSYMLWDRVWEESVRRAQRKMGPGKASTYDKVCVSCLEKRLDRRLNFLDFDFSIPLNGPGEVRSSKLRLRMRS